MRFVVPQFIDVEDKIIGQLSMRQFLISLGTISLVYVWFKVFHFFPFVFVASFTLGIGAIFAFLKINGQAFHYFLLTITQDARKPSKRIWNNHNSVLSAQDASVPKMHKQEVAATSKVPISASRLTKLALIVDTGGSYQDDRS